MRVRHKIFIILTLILLLTVFLLVRKNNQIAYEQVLDGLERLAVQIRVSFEAEQHAAALSMQQVATFIASDPEVQQLFLRGKKAVQMEGGGAGGRMAAILRERLYQHLEPGYRNLQQKFGLSQLQFHIAPGALSFLLVHSPEIYGDRLEDIRHAVVAANTQLRDVTGFESGQMFSGLRGVVPVHAYDLVTNSRVHVGALEAGVAYPTLIKLFKKNHPDLDAAAILSLDHLQQAAVREGSLTELRSRSFTTENVVLEAASSPLVEEIIKSDLFGDIFSVPGNHLWRMEGKDYSIVSFPLRDFHGESDPAVPHAGRILVWKDVSAEMAALKASRGRNLLEGMMIFCLVETLILFGVRITTSQLQKELEQTRKLGQVGKKAADLASRIDERVANPQLQLQAALQEQIEEATRTTAAEFGIFVCPGNGQGQYRLMAASKMVWSSIEGSQLYRQATVAMQQDGFFQLEMESNLLAAAVKSNQPMCLDSADCQRLIGGRFPAGHPVISSLLVMPVQAAGHKLGFLALANRKEGFGSAEEYLARAYAAAAALIIHADMREIARLGAEESSRLKTEFLRNMSHELRTPLNTIMGLGQLLGESVLAPREKAYVNQINQSSEALLHLIDEILMIAKLDVLSHDQLRPVEFDPLQLLNRVAENFAMRAEKQGVRIKVESDQLLPAQVCGHPLQLEQILHQLVGNAIKFSHGGQVLLALRLAASDKQQLKLEFSVTDQGVGISREQHEMIFQPFQQGDGSRVRTYGGTGLGLTIVAKLCQLLGGSVSVESAPGEGSCFTITIKVDKAAAIPQQPLHGQPDGVGVVPEDSGSCELYGTVPELINYLQQLEAPLAKLQPLPCQNLAKELKARHWPVAQQQEVSILVSLIGKYRFQEAGKKLVQIQETL